MSKHRVGSRNRVREELHKELRAQGNIGVTGTGAQQEETGGSHSHLRPPKVTHEKQRQRCGREGCTLKKN
jgi:hypothetical protein